MSSRIHWVVSTALALAVVYLSVKLQDKPREVIKEKLVDRPVEVIKEIPVERVVEKRVEVIKEVERKLTAVETWAIQDQKNRADAKLLSKNSDLLRGILKVTVMVSLGDELEKSWSAKEMKDKVTLELRKIGIQVLQANEPGSQANVLIIVDSLKESKGELGTTIYSATLSVNSNINAMTWDSMYHIWSSDLWHTTTFGFFGSEKAKEAQRAAIEMLTENLASIMLEANPIKRD